jgi:hypothetical protein
MGAIIAVARAATTAHPDFDINTAISSSVGEGERDERARQASNRPLGGYFFAMARS